MLSDQQKLTAQAIVNIFETGSAEGDYGNVTLLAGDSGHLTYGRSQTTLASGNLYLLVRDYCAASDARFAAALSPYLTKLKAKDVSLDNDSVLKSLLKQAGDDTVMQEVQDAFFDSAYWTPAFKDALSAGLSLPLSVAVVHDSRVHGSWQAISKKTTADFGKTSDIGEKPWIEGYIKTRHSFLANHTNTLLRKTIYRMVAFQNLIQAGNWHLEPPVVVRGVTVPLRNVDKTLKVVILADNTLVQCNAKLEKDRVRVDMRPVCEALKIALPTGEVLATMIPNVIPPGVTRVNLRPLLEQAGWEPLTHRMADEGKIYLRKNA